MKVTLLGISILALIVGCGKQNSSGDVPASKQTTMRTDAAPITRRLPKLGPLQWVRWKAVETSIDSFLSPPIHPAYRVKGLAQLENTNAQEFARNYEWQRMPASWKPEITITNESMTLSDWNRSDAFTKDCKAQQLPGDLFFERSSGVVYFDIEVE